jgi:hypothetical protein
LTTDNKIILGVKGILPVDEIKSIFNKNPLNNKFFSELIHDESVIYESLICESRIYKYYHVEKSESLEKLAEEIFLRNCVSFLEKKIDNLVLYSEVPSDGIYRSDGIYHTKKTPLDEIYDKCINIGLPELMAKGFVNAMEKYKKDNFNESKICCILNIDSESKMSFVYGDGENNENELVFYEYFDDIISRKLSGSKIMMEIMTTNFAQEYTKSLTIAVKKAEEQKAFENISITIYGKLIVFGHDKTYGPYNIDIQEIIYTNIN